MWFFTKHSTCQPIRRVYFNCGFPDGMIPPFDQSWNCLQKSYQPQTGTVCKLTNEKRSFWSISINTSSGVYFSHSFYLVTHLKLYNRVFNLFNSLHTIKFSSIIVVYFKPQFISFACIVSLVCLLWWSERELHSISLNTFRDCLGDIIIRFWLETFW